MSDGRSLRDVPWQGLPALAGPPLLQPSGASLDTLFELPPGSGMTVARVDPATGVLRTASWRGTGEQGFYPASTIKWITGALTVERRERFGLEPDDVLEVEGAPPRTFRDLLLSMLVMSDNDAFNVLQEAVGFAETHERLRGWGCRHALVRRHFVRPRYNHSRGARVWDAGGRVKVAWPPRPAVDLPLNSDPRPAPVGCREQNWMTPDDLVRIAAATLMGPTRRCRAYGLFVQGLGWTNQAYVREGLQRVTASEPGRPAYAVLNKPGWWPPDRATSELAYVYDVARDEHTLIGVFVEGSEAQAREGISSAAEAVFRAVARGVLPL